MVMRQVGSVSAHNEYNCLPQVATKSASPAIGSERPGKEKKKKNKYQNPTTIQRAHCFEYSPKI